MDHGLREQSERKAAEKRFDTFDATKQLEAVEERLHASDGTNRLKALEERLDALDYTKQIKALEERLDAFDGANWSNALEERLNAFDCTKQLKALEGRLDTFDGIIRLQALQERLDAFDGRKQLKALEERLDTFDCTDRLKSVGERLGQTDEKIRDLPGEILFSSSDDLPAIAEHVQDIARRCEQHFQEVDALFKTNGSNLGSSINSFRQLVERIAGDVESLPKQRGRKTEDQTDETLKHVPRKIASSHLASSRDDLHAITKQLKALEERLNVFDGANRLSALEERLGALDCTKQLEALEERLDTFDGIIRLQALEERLNAFDGANRLNALEERIGSFDCKKQLKALEERAEAFDGNQLKALEEILDAFDGRKHDLLRIAELEADTRATTQKLEADVRAHAEVSERRFASLEGRLASLESTFDSTTKDDSLAKENLRIHGRTDIETKLTNLGESVKDHCKEKLEQLEQRLAAFDEASASQEQRREQAIARIENNCQRLVRDFHDEILHMAKKFVETVLEIYAYIDPVETSHREDPELAIGSLRNEIAGTIKSLRDDICGFQGSQRPIDEPSFAKTGINTPPPLTESTSTLAIFSPTVNTAPSRFSPASSKFSPPGVIRFSSAPVPGPARATPPMPSKRVPFSAMVQPELEPYSRVPTSPTIANPMSSSLQKIASATSQPTLSTVTSGTPHVMFNGRKSDLQPPFKPGPASCLSKRECNR